MREKWPFSKNQKTAAIELRTETDTSFIIGSAIKHPHALARGYHSVHTSRDALEQGEAYASLPARSREHPDPRCSDCLARR
jgi:hypothetical protein